MSQAQVATPTATPATLPEPPLGATPVAVPGATATLPPVPTLPPAPAPPAESDGRPVATAIPLDQSPPGLAELPFSLIDQRTFELRSPADLEAFNFDIPFRWLVKPDQSYIEVHYDTVAQTSAPGQIPVIEVWVNGEFAGTFLPQPGPNQVARIPLPPSAFVKLDDYQKDVRFILYAGRDCTGIDRIRVTVRDDSFVHLAYDTLPLLVNLADFPQPLEQGLYLPETVLIVIPEAYSDADLAAVAAVSAALGEKSTTSDITVEVITALAATPERLANANAILIGRPLANEYLAGLYQRNLLPTTANADGLLTSKAGQPIAAEEGVLQEIPSDANPDMAFLIVTGATDEAVQRAASALSSDQARFGFDSNLVVIDAVAPVAERRRFEAERLTLEQMGFRDTTLFGTGSKRTTASFFLPGNWIIDNDASLVLNTVHSSALAPYASGVTVLLNDRSVGSVPVEAGQETRQQVVIPLSPSDFRLGETNRLTFNAFMDVAQECLPPDTEVAWIRIRNDSTLDLPHLSGATNQVELALSSPFNGFGTRQDLADVWLVLPQNPTAAELTGMARLAWELGDLTGGPGFAPKVSRGIPGLEAVADFHVIAIGRPTNNAVMPLVNEALIQPFVPGEDAMRQTVGNVTYRLPAGFGVGVLELLPAPWNSQQTLLVVSGSTQQGVEWALNALTDPELAGTLDGDLGFVREERVESLNSKELVVGAVPVAVSSVLTGTVGAVEGAVPQSLSGGILTEVPEVYLPPRGTRPLGITLLALALLLAGGGVVAAGIVWQRRRRRSFINE